MTERRYPLARPLHFDCPSCGATMALNTAPVVGGMYHRLCDSLEPVPMHGPFPCPKCHHSIRVSIAVTAFAERVKPEAKPRPALRVLPPIICDDCS